MRRRLLLVLPAAWLLTVAASTAPTPSPIPSPSTTATATPAPTPTATPAPRTGLLALDPTFGPPGTKITVGGTGFQPNQPVQLYFDAPATALPGATADAAGAFKVQVDAPEAAVGPHTICSPQAATNAPCATFRLEAKPSPSPSQTPTASPSPTAVASVPPTAAPSAAPTPVATSTTAVGLLTQPPFVFFPILLVAAALLSVAWIWWGRRAPAAPARATVRHASTPPAVPVVPAAEPAAAATPAEVAPQEPPPPPRATPGDESIDLPDPGE